jgi:CubicO group peptidase (beta-lactamase class C family)
LKSYSVLETADFLPQFIHKPANFEPGHGCRYNNVGFILLGLCVEKAAGMRYRDYVRERVFGPAGMAGTGFFRMDDVAQNVAEGADPVVAADGVVTSWRRNIYSYPPIGSPDGGAYATAPDLDRFMRAARTGRLFSARLTGGGSCGRTPSTRPRRLAAAGMGSASSSSPTRTTGTGSSRRTA